jgi:hypothetical protein
MERLRARAMRGDVFFEFLGVDFWQLNRIRIGWGWCWCWCCSWMLMPMERVGIMVPILAHVWLRIGCCSDWSCRRINSNQWWFQGFLFHQPGLCSSIFPSALATLPLSSSTSLSVFYSRLLKFISTLLCLQCVLFISHSTICLPQDLLIVSTKSSYHTLNIRASFPPSLLVNVLCLKKKASSRPVSPRLVSPRLVFLLSCAAHSYSTHSPVTPLSLSLSPLSLSLSPLCI